MTEYADVKKLKQELFIDALLQLGSVEAACNRLQISRRTYYRWLKDEKFQKKLEQKKRFIYNASIDHMAKLLNHALNSYQDLLYCKSDNVRFKAASDIIKNSHIITNAKKTSDQYNEWLEIQYELELERTQEQEQSQQQDDAA